MTFFFALNDILRIRNVLCEDVPIFLSFSSFCLCSEISSHPPNQSDAKSRLKKPLAFFGANTPLFWLVIEITLLVFRVKTLEPNACGSSLTNLIKSEISPRSKQIVFWYVAASWTLSLKYHENKDLFFLFSWKEKDAKYFMSVNLTNKQWIQEGDG